MVFSSQTFLFFFLPLASLCLFIKKTPIQNALLLILSLFFYAWGEPAIVFLLIGVTGVAWLGSIAESRLEQKGKVKTAKGVFVTVVILILSNLFVFKYLGFLTFGLVKIALPIGISFYTFQILSYVIDRHMKRVELQKNFFYLLMYVSFFPQLIAGPIVRYKTIEKQIRERSATINDIAIGFRRFVIGLAKKVLIANQVAAIADIIYSSDSSSYGMIMFWVAAFAYTFQIYFDFSGYSDMAIGLGRMFGFHFDENFSFPYRATSITDFWRRWHISLSTFFRDYVYIPLGGSRNGVQMQIRNILIVWILTGIWHGAGWNFIIWGFYYAILLIIEKFVIGKYIERIPKIIRSFICFIIVTVGWVIFNKTELSSLKYTLIQMISFRKVSIAASLRANVSLLSYIPFMVLAAVCSFVEPPKKITGSDSLIALTVKNTACIVILVICIAFSISEKFNPFIYFHF